MMWSMHESMNKKYLTVALFAATILLATINRVSAQTVGTCKLGSAIDTLDVNNVRASVFNAGQLFWRGSGNVYTVPKDGQANAIFASGIWLGGLDENEQLRFAGTAYGPFEYFPGPLNELGDPPSDCSEYDRIFNVSLEDIKQYENTGQLTDDIRDWPADLGAPVVDGDGIDGNYNLAAGDRPDITGDQMLWWVMNDVGGVKEWSKTEPMGVEIQASAFAFHTNNALDNTTFFRYRIENKGNVEMRDLFFGIWADPDLGNAADDFVGSDSTLGMAIAYNGDDIDEGFDGYGDRPAAVGFDFVQGALVPATRPGTIWTDPDGTKHPGRMRQGMYAFVYYNGDSSVLGNPDGDTNDPYNYLRAIWRDNSPMTYGGNGYGRSEVTRYMFSGDAARKEYWSEENTDGFGSRNTPADRRFLLSTGPFNLLRGDVQEIVVAIVWSRSSSRLASYSQLKEDDIFVQRAFDLNFESPEQISTPALTAQPVDNGVVLEWSNPPESNNFLERYEALSWTLLPNPPTLDETHTFEGYIVYEFESEDDDIGIPIAVYDVPNEVKEIAEEAKDEESGIIERIVTIRGSDSGVRRSHYVDSLNNFRDYYFGVQAYAYNENSLEPVRRSEISRVTVAAGPVESLSGGTVTNAAIGDSLSFVRTMGTGTATGLLAVVDNPLGLQADTYEIRMYDHPFRFAGTDSAEFVLTYDIVRLSDESLFYDGSAFVDSLGNQQAFGENVFSLDGLSLNIDTAPTDFEAFLTVANGAGVLDPPTGAAADFQNFPVPERPTDLQQVGNGIWFVHTGDNGSRGPYDAFIGRSIRNGFGPVVPFDWEIRFTPVCYDAWRTATDAGTPFATPADGCYGYDRFGIFGDDRPQLVPFELWNIGAGTPDDASDDFRLVPAIIDWDGDGYDMQWFDHSVSSTDNDPETDWTYWYNPLDRTPGTVGYDNWQKDLLSGEGADHHDNEIMARFVWVNWNGGSVSAATDKADYLANHVNQDMPEPGTVFRMTTTKPLSDGDVFQLSTVDAAPITNETSVAKSALERIGISPNPYYGISDYEKGLVDTEVRFTNMPDKATIRVFTLAGSLVRTLEKNDNNSFLSFNLRNEHGNWLASGMYLIHVEVPGVGDRTLKFGLVQRNKSLQ